MARLWFRETSEGVTFRVHVQPRAARNRLQGMHDDALKISLTAPPVEGAANRLCRDFLAGLLELPRARVEVVGGHKSRRKTIYVENLNGLELKARLGLNKLNL
ncbi:MAG: YggU family protein [Deltaproteobacteria bacterium]|nr:YggU family protein [Candidatus Tharpella sp.]